MATFMGCTHFMSLLGKASLFVLFQKAPYSHVLKPFSRASMICLEYDMLGYEETARGLFQYNWNIVPYKNTNINTKINKMCCLTLAPTLDLITQDVSTLEGPWSLSTAAVAVGTCGMWRGCLDCAPWCQNGKQRFMKMHHEVEGGSETAECFYSAGVKNSIKQVPRRGDNKKPLESIARW